MKSVRVNELLSFNGLSYETSILIPYTGEVISYHENGQIATKDNYKDGKLNGESIFYYENGQIQRKGNYKDGYPDGEMNIYDENGQIEL